ncbi:hypothetical protein CC86DRAFT_446784 [Ophiobolus disseminans]|uniref:Rhodopsin domain-containing protein n=1 Tax=Ophiobolus disseminans TaxID=1469910 RepID=A0A6A6ZWX0_9PLEO|nr:hypothetical protein CC86DRAFT_446784 [Ophiobolus disseminans]
MGPGGLYSNPRDDPLNAHLPNINQQATILGVTITMLALALIAITLRLWVRVRDRLWGWDDAFVLLAGIASAAGDIIVCLTPNDGMGLHFQTLNRAHRLEYFKHIYSSNIAYCASTTCIKLAILFQYLRLFSESSSLTSTSRYRLARQITISLIVLCSLWGFTFFWLSIFPCKPVALNWDTTLKGKCIGWGSKDPNHFYAMFAAHSASNMFLDILVLLVPLPFLSTLRLAGRSKAGLMTLFTLGIIVCAVSIGRMISLAINKAGTVPVMNMSFHVPIVYIFSVLEVNIAIIAASIPIFWPAIVTLATNKIWVVNEIEIRVENNSRNSLSSAGDIGLAEHGSWSKLDNKDDPDRRTSRLSVLAKAYDRTSSRSHQHKHSNASTICRTLGHDAGERTSNDSQRILFLNAGREGSNATLGRDEWLAEADRQNAMGTTTTTIKTADVPYEQIRKMER